MRRQPERASQASECCCSASQAAMVRASAWVGTSYMPCRRATAGSANTLNRSTVAIRRRAAVQQTSFKCVRCRIRQLPVPSSLLQHFPLDSFSVVTPPRRGFPHCLHTVCDLRPHPQPRRYLQADVLPCVQFCRASHAHRWFACDVLESHEHHRGVFVHARRSWRCKYSLGNQSSLPDLHSL